MMNKHGLIKPGNTIFTGKNKKHAISHPHEKACFLFVFLL